MDDLAKDAWRDRRKLDFQVNLTRPEFRRVLNAHLAVAAGGLGIVADRNGMKFETHDVNDPLYREMLEALTEAKTALEKRPRMDMPGGVAVPQDRKFSKVF